MGVQLERDVSFDVSSILESKAQAPSARKADDTDDTSVPRAINIPTCRAKQVAQVKEMDTTRSGDARLLSCF